MQTKEKVHKTTCCYCGVGCGMLVKKDKKGKITVEGDPGNPVNKGMLCSKGMNLHYTAMDHSDRLLYPMLRDDIKQDFKQISWETAIQKAASKFKKIIKEHGSNAVGFYVSGQCLTEEYYLANKIMKGFIGSNNIDTNSRLCMSSAVSAYKLALGEDSVPGCYEDIEFANTFLIAGANPAWCHPILFRRIEAHKARNDHVRIIVADPRRTQTAASADLHLQIIPGTDIVLFHALARGLMENGFIDEQFIRDHTTGFEALKEKVMQRTLQEAAAVCGIRFTDIYKAVKYIGLSGGFMSLWAMGLNQSAIGVNKNLALINLSLITGKIGKPGSGPFSLTGQTNAMGGREVGGMATLSSAHRDLSNPVHRREIADHWKVPDLPATPGLTATQMVTALHEGKMKALWIICTNPLVSIPNSPLVEAALAKAAFVVVQDISTKADTLSFAHLALPAATWLEKEGTITNSERRISHLSKVVEPPGEALPDSEILLRFAKAMGWEEHFNYSSCSEIYREHALLTKNTHLDISGLDYDSLKNSGSVQWPLLASSPHGTPRLFTDHRFYFPDGKAKIHAVPDENLSEKVSEAFPLILTTGRIRDQWHTMTRSGKVNKLKQHIPHPVLEIHPNDASERDIRDGDPVVISNERGAVQVMAKLSGEIKKGVVFLPMHWGRLAGRSFARANNLTNSLVDAVSLQPDFKYSAVQVAPYHRPPQKIVIAGESENIPALIKEFRSLGMTDSIDWFCGDMEKFFYTAAEMIACLKENKISYSSFDSKTMANEMDINIIKEISIVSINREKKCVADSTNKIYPYDHLIIAPIAQPGKAYDHVTDEILHWRNKRAVVSLIQSVRPPDALVLIGDNPVVCEAAFALAEKGIRIYILTERETWLENILDETSASLSEEIVQDAGIEILHNEKISLVEQHGSMQKIIFKSGKHLICRAVISFTDEYPDLAIAKAAGLKINDVLEVNAFLQTSDPSIFALGEATVFNSEDSHLSGAGIRQAQCLAQYFRGNYSQYYTGTIPRYKWRMQADFGTDKADLKISVMGNVRPASDEDFEEIVFLDRQKYIYKKCIIQNDRLTGAIFIGNDDEDSSYLTLIEQGAELGELRSQLLRPGDAGISATSKIVCSCNQVGEANIIAAIKGGCKTIEALSSHTGAGTKCGSCKPELREMLKKK